MARQLGFTLVELIAVITLSGILALVIWRNIAAPMQGFEALDRRARLTDAAETALQRLTRELRLALPNSMRVDPGGSALELLRTRAGGRYRRLPAAAGASDPLDFALTADSFDVLGGLAEAAAIRTSAGGLADCLSGAGDCLAIYNTGSPADCLALPAGTRANAWCGDNLAGITAASATQLGFSRADAGTPLPLQSPAQRFFVVDTPVSFVCDLPGRTLRRYAGYPIAATQSVPPAAGGALLAEGVTGCAFRYDPGTATRGGLLTIELALSEDGESVTLLQQVHVPNSP